MRPSRKKIYKNTLVLISIILVISILILNIKIPTSGTYVFDDTLISQIKNKTNNYILIEDVPDNLKNAIISTEDKRFNYHFGIDPIAIARATYLNIKNKEIVQGASTITQQLAKNLFLSNDRNFTRKFKEMILALQIEKEYSKDEILEMYLNVIYLGSDSYGIGDASKNYFDKKVSDLSLSECALIAGLPQAPSLYDPTVNFEAAKKRQEEVLRLMEKNRFIDKSRLIDAIDSSIAIFK